MPASSAGPASDTVREPILFNQAFEGASLGKIEQVGETAYRLHVAGQYDERGHNRQATWYHFRMDRVAGRKITLTFTDWVGEYNDRPGTVPMSGKLRPWFSEDGVHWRPFPDLIWDDAKKAATITFIPEGERIWIAHLQPYPHSRLLRLLEEVDDSPHACIEVIGQTVLGRDLHLVTVTNLERPDAGKKTVWLQARQHAWETGTSFALEGALRFIVSDDPAAGRLRDSTIFKFMPMGDPDGCATGGVRFNANGYDLNRHWDRMDLRDKTLLHAMPETWYVKKAIVACLEAGQRIDLLVNLHNTRTEFIDTAVDAEPERAMMQRLFDSLVAKEHFDPSRPMGLPGAGGSMLALWPELRVPVALLELRTEPGRKHPTLPTAGERLAFGRELIMSMAEAVQ